MNNELKFFDNFGDIGYMRKCKCEEEKGTNKDCSYCKEYVEACALGEFLKPKTIKKYPKAKLTSCKDHEKGCYLDLLEGEKIEHSEEVEAILDFNKKGEIVGIDFPSGVKE